MGILSTSFPVILFGDVDLYCFSSRKLCEASTMRRMFGLVTTFYRPVLEWNLSISVMSLLFTLLMGKLSLPICILTFLTAGYVFSLYVNHVMHKQEYPFYINAGFPLHRLVFWAFGMNTILGIILGYLAVFLRV